MKYRLLRTSIVLHDTPHSNHEISQSIYFLYSTSIWRIWYGGKKINFWTSPSAEWKGRSLFGSVFFQGKFRRALLTTIIRRKFNNAYLRTRLLRVHTLLTPSFPFSLDTRACILVFKTIVMDFIFRWEQDWIDEWCR